MHFNQFHEMIVPNVCILGLSKLTDYLPVWSVMPENVFCMPFLLNYYSNSYICLGDKIFL